MTASIKVMLLEHKNIVVIIFYKWRFSSSVINRLDHREYWGWRWDGGRWSAVVVTPKVTCQKKKQKQKQKQQQSAKPQKQN